MPLSSKKISRLEKEAILRSKVGFHLHFLHYIILFIFSIIKKDFDYKREQASHLLTNSYQDEESFENERHRRHDIMRQTRQIQREIDHQVGLIDKIGERRELETLKKQTATSKFLSLN